MIAVDTSTALIIRRYTNVLFTLQQMHNSSSYMLSGVTIGAEGGTGRGDWNLQEWKMTDQQKNRGWNLQDWTRAQQARGRKTAS